MLQVQRQREGPFDEQLGYARRLMVLHALLALFGLGLLLWAGVVWAASLLGLWWGVAVLLVGAIHRAWLRDGRLLASWTMLAVLGGVAFLLWGMPAEGGSVDPQRAGLLRLGIGALNLGYGWLAVALWRSQRFDRAARYGFRSRL